MEYRSGAVSGSDAVGRAWELIGNSYWTFFGMNLLMVVIVFAISMVLSGINQAIVLGMMFVSDGGISEESLSGGMPLVPQLVSMIIGLFVNIVVYAVSGALTCGFLMAVDEKARTGQVNFGLLFSGFSKLVPCGIFAVIYSVAGFALGLFILVVALVFGLSADPFANLSRSGTIQPSEGFFVFFALIAVVSIVGILIFTILTTFVYPLIAIRNLSAADAVMTSIRAGVSNFGGILALLLLFFLLSVAGAIACGIGIFFVLPIFPAAIYAAFRQAFGDEPGSSREDGPPPPPVWSQPEGFQSGY